MTYLKSHLSILCLLLVCAMLQTSECVGALVSTVNQPGAKTIFVDAGGNPTGSRVHLGRFSFPVGYSQFTEFRFRGWVERADDALGVSPTLVFAPINTSSFDLQLGNANVITTSLSFANSSNSVEEQQSGWTAFSGTDGTRLANFINSQGGLVDVWFISNFDPDFWFPESTTTFVMGPGFKPIPVVVPYTATVELSPVPEPFSSTVFMSLIATSFVFRPSRYFRKRS